MILYKYRGFSNFEFAIDIFINQRLYAANFQKLNDPMEGKFIYNLPFDSDKHVIKEIIGGKSTYGIVALSKTPINHLLWSYYAESHTGFAVGVEIVPGENVSVEEIQYVDHFYTENIGYGEVKKILLRKHSIWSHEEEYRVLKKLNYENGNFIKIEVKELIFGTRASDSQKEIITKIAKKFCHNIIIRTIEESEIEKGIL